MKKKALIFDLDNCLCAASTAGEGLYAPAFAAIRDANRGTLADDELQRAFDECWTTAFDAVAQRHRFSAAMFAAGDAVFRRLEVDGPLVAYPDLPVVRELAARRYLVTSGYRRLQDSKIRRLGIADWFEAVVIDAADEPDHPGKQRIFAALAADARLAPGEVLVVGDNPHSELAAGRALGMTTVQILRPGVARSDVAAHHVETLDALHPLLR